MIENALIVLHVFAGSLALLGGALATFGKTFALPHRVHVVGGNIFVYSMALVSVTAIPMTISGKGIFFLFIGIFRRRWMAADVTAVMMCALS